MKSAAALLKICVIYNCIYQVWDLHASCEDEEDSAGENIRKTCVRCDTMFVEAIYNLEIKNAQ